MVRIKASRIGPIVYFPECIIGRGATSIVYKGCFEVPGTKAAVKKIDGDKCKIFERELEILRLADHPNIVRYFASETRVGASGSKSYFIAMGLANLTLEDCVNKKSPKCSPTTTRQMVKYLEESAWGLRYLHFRNILHRDIKPKNILIFCNGKNYKTAKLADFGISRKVSNFQDGTSSLGQGSLDWMSPEAMRSLDEKFLTTDAIDIFSLGLTMFYSHTKGSHPFGTIRFRYDNIADVNKQPELNKLNENDVALKNLLQAMLSKVPEYRPSISAVIQHPFFGVVLEH